MVSLRSALDEAFGSKYKQQSVIEQRPLALYLHRDDGIAQNIFAQNVFFYKKRQLQNLGDVF